jgi:hypothetical protein
MCEELEDQQQVTGRGRQHEGARTAAPARMMVASEREPAMTKLATPSRHQGPQRRVGRRR